MLDEAVAGSSSYTQPGISGNTAPQMDERLTAALHFINTHYNESPLLLKAVSKSAGLSIWHFSRLFNAHIGMGFRKYLKNIRIKQACKLLATSNLTIKEIAANVGYTHLSDFYHHFKERFDVSPMLYRRRVRNSYINHMTQPNPIESNDSQHYGVVLANT